MEIGKLINKWEFSQFNLLTRYLRRPITFSLLIRKYQIQRKGLVASQRGRMPTTNCFANLSERKLCSWTEEYLYKEEEVEEKKDLPQAPDEPRKCRCLSKEISQVALSLCLCFERRRRKFSFRYGWSEQESLNVIYIGRGEKGIKHKLC